MLSLSLSLSLVSEFVHVNFQVVRAISNALDDPKRAVRQEAVRCRQAWLRIQDLYSCFS